MSCEITVTNTVAFLFPKGAAQPTLEEMASFVKTLVADKSDMESAYKISEERSVYVKFKTEAHMKKALLKNNVKHTFRYSNGKVAEVLMSVAGGNVRYVRIFDLPPEVNDRQISLVLEKFGKIKRMDREKFPIDLGMGDLSTGIRGVHMDIEKEIPPILCFAGRKGRLYYEQMTPRCYFCFSEGHFKAACPNKKTKQKRKPKQSGDSHTYAEVAGCSTSCENGDKAEQGKEDSKRNEEKTAAPTAAADNDTTHETEISDEEEMEEEMDESTEDEGSRKQKQTMEKLVNIIQTYKKKKEEEEQSKAAEKQRQQRKKPVTRAKSGSFSPPMKKKY